MVDLVLGSLELLGSLLVNLALVLLLLIQFINKFVLMGDLVVQIPDLVVLRGLILLRLLEIQFEVFDVFFQPGDLLLELLLVLEEIVPGVLLFLESVADVL